MASLGDSPVALSALLGSHASPEAEPDDAAIPQPIRHALIDAGRRMDARTWVPATAGNLSHRLGPNRIAITRSGCHKGHLTDDDIIEVDDSGAPLGPHRPSAETLLHCQIYQHLPHINAVLHGHSLAATVLSRLAGPSIELSDYEVLKAFPAIRTHQATIAVPVFDNDQHMPSLAARIAPHFAAGLPAGYLIRGHGAYAWGEDMPTALARLEALEFLLACDLEHRKCR